MDFKSIMSLFREDDWAGELVDRLDEMLELSSRMFSYTMAVVIDGANDADPQAELFERDKRINQLMRKIRRRVVTRLSVGGRRGEIPTALIYTNSRNAPAVIRRARGLAFCSPSAMKPEHSAVTARYVEHHHRKGRTVIPWTVDDPAEARRLASAGVDGIITNVPDLIMEEFASQG